MSPDAALLLALRKSAPVGISLPQLAAECGLPPGAVQAQMDHLSEAGFRIEFAADGTLHLRSAPSHLVADDLRARLGEATRWRNLVVFRETSSTNDLALRAGSEGAADGLVFLAENQTAGRGRFQRVWNSAPGRGIYLSALLRPAFAVSHWPRLAFAAAWAVTRVCERFLRRPAQIKWPNDIWIDDRKISGILLESRVIGDLGFVVIGIGLNVRQMPEDFPEDLRPIATSMRIASGADIDRAEVAAALLQSLDRACGMVSEEFGLIREEIQKRSVLQGKMVRITGPGSDYSGTVEGIDPDGALLLRMADGTLCAVASGEATLHVPPLGQRPRLTVAPTQVRTGV